MTDNDLPPKKPRPEGYGFLTHSLNTVQIAGLLENILSKDILHQGDSLSNCSKSSYLNFHLFTKLR